MDEVIEPKKIKRIDPLIFVLLTEVVIGLFWFKETHSFLYLLLVAFILLATVCIYYLTRFSRHALKKRGDVDVAYLFALIFSLLVFTFAFPPFSAPDELHHFYSSYWIADAFLGEGDLSSGDFLISLDTKQFASDMMDSAQEGEGIYDIGQKTYRELGDWLANPRTNRNKIKVNEYDFSVGSENLPAKLGSVGGVLLARLLDLSPVALFYAGRIGSAVFYLLIVYSAYKIIPKCKSIIMIPTLLPMSLHLAASYSYDSGIIALSFLLIALLLKIVLTDDYLGPADIALLVVVSTLLAPCKVVYAPIILLIVLVPSSRFRTKREMLIVKAAVLFCMTASVLAVRSSSMGALASEGGSLDYRGSESGHFYSLSMLISQPVMTVKLFIRTFYTFGDFYLSSMVGGILGWLQQDISIPMFFIFLYVLVAIVVVIADCHGVRFSFPFKLGMACVFVLSVLGSMLSMCLGHTFNTELVIMGVQGRYFLPVVPLALILIGSNCINLSLERPLRFGLNATVFLNSLNILSVIGMCLTLP